MKNTFTILLVMFVTNTFSQNVGVGTTSPKEMLDVNGNINVAGTIKVNGIDGTANQLLMKNGSGILSWGNTPNPASVQDTSRRFSSQTLRSLWVTDTTISVTVPETGKYLIFFHGNMSNNNQYFGYETNRDTDGWIRIFNSTSNTEIFRTIALNWYSDLYTPNDAMRKYMEISPSGAIMANVNANDVLRLQYIQFFNGAVAPAGTWGIGNGGISILKIGN